MKQNSFITLSRININTQISMILEAPNEQRIK
uniref:Uncharacterized protein n=1 Tax=Rhizophora mucronata TaxID=61149 RepID=A0A2P2N1D6_RHIMU